MYNAIRIVKLGQGTKLHFLSCQDSPHGDYWSTMCGQAYGKMGMGGPTLSTSATLDDITCNKCKKHVDRMRAERPEALVTKEDLALEA